MDNQNKSKNPIYLRIIKNFIYILLASIMIFLLIKSLTSTATVKEDVFEIVYYNYDNYLNNIFMLIFYISICLLLYPILLKIKIEHITIFVFCATLIMGVIWVINAQIGLNGDSSSIITSAYQFTQGDYSVLTRSYFRHYPFQLGFTMICQLFMTVFSWNDNAIPFALVNIICLGLTYVGIILLCTSIFEKEIIAKYCGVLCLFCFTAIFFCTFAYSIVISLMFSIWGIYIYTKYYETNKIKYLCFSSFLLAVSYLVKTNAMIVIIALIIVSFAYIMSERDGKYLVFIIIVIVLSVSFKSATILAYENKGNIDLGDSEPLVGWLAMGLQESERAPGWYNGFNYNNFEASGLDSDIAKENAIKEIKKSFKKFIHNPSYAKDFFESKICSQWNEPTFESLWFGQSRPSYIERKGIFKAAYENIDSNLFYYYMNFYQQFIYMLTFVFFITNIKKYNLNNIIIPLIIVGGFVYHTLFEAKSQFIFIYFLLMIPLASYGIVELKYLVKKYLIKRKKYR
ncbi:hypothetical protein ACH52_0683 [Eubacterium limosum]|nr:hypothetical protein ACH52_0683 [Eubacterium limosum]